jgi:hypothetical protein
VGEREEVTNRVRECESKRREREFSLQTVNLCIRETEEERAIEQWWQKTKQSKSKLKYGRQERIKTKPQIERGRKREGERMRNRNRNRDRERKRERVVKIFQYLYSFFTLKKY